MELGSSTLPLCDRLETGDLYSSVKKKNTDCRVPAKFEFIAFVRKFHKKKKKKKWKKKKKREQLTTESKHA